MDTVVKLQKNAGAAIISITLSVTVLIDDGDGREASHSLVAVLGANIMAWMLILFSGPQLVEAFSKL
ncbi:hypothetical protein ACMFMG_009583 [Clarireedia jacksonii]